MPKFKNQILITVDSCRFDTFENAQIPFLKSLDYARCYSQATFTMAAHQAFFAGKLPHAFNGRKYFDAASPNLRKRLTQPQIWRLANPESAKPSYLVLEGRNIKDGFRKLGFTTIGTGAMNWFDPSKEASQALTVDFDHYNFFHNANTRDGRNVRQQVDWALEMVSTVTEPYFLFINIGETHHRYAAEGHSLEAEWGDPQKCALAQQASLEYVDQQLKRLFDGLEKNFLAVICGDHGDCWGEDGLWGHGFYHPMVMEVPLAIYDTGVWESGRRMAQKLLGN